MYINLYMQSFSDSRKNHRPFKKTLFSQTPFTLRSYWHKSGTYFFDTWKRVQLCTCRQEYRSRLWSTPEKLKKEGRLKQEDLILETTGLTLSDIYVHTYIYLYIYVHVWIYNHTFTMSHALTQVTLRRESHISHLTHDSEYRIWFMWEWLMEIERDSCGTLETAHVESDESPTRVTFYSQAHMSHALFSYE